MLGKTKIKSKESKQRTRVNQLSRKESYRSERKRKEKQ
jgi:hypothetical protein